MMSHAASGFIPKCWGFKEQTDDISLISLRDGAETLNYTEDELKGLFERILRCSNEVVELNKKVKEFLP